MRAALLIAAAVALSAAGAERRGVYPASGPKPVGPYTPGIVAGDYLYVSGQGALDAAGKMPAGFEDQARLTLNNLKAIVEAAGLTMAHVVYTQCFLDNLANLDAFEKIYREFFAKDPPARVVAQAARMPVKTPVEVNAVAVMDVSKRKPVSGGVATHDRLYLFSGDRPPSRDMVLATVFVLPGTTFAPPKATARATVEVAGLPGSARVAISGVAPSEPGGRIAGTFYSPVLSDPANAPTVEYQTRNTLALLRKTLEQEGLTLANVVASNVYLGNIDDFAKMNRVYAEHFRELPPTRTTIQPAASSDRLFRISVVAVR